MVSKFVVPKLGNYMKSGHTNPSIPRLKRSSAVPSQRQRRIAEVIRHALANIFEQKNLRDPFFSQVRLTVTEVNIGGDLKTATVFMFFPESVPPREALQQLKQAKNEIRAQLPKYLELKFIPDLIFKYDNSLEYSQRMDLLLRRISTQQNS